MISLIDFGPKKNRINQNFRLIWLLLLWVDLCYD